MQTPTHHKKGNLHFSVQNVEQCFESKMNEKAIFRFYFSQLLMILFKISQVFLTNQKIDSFLGISKDAQCS